MHTRCTVLLLTLACAPLPPEAPVPADAGLVDGGAAKTDANLHCGVQQPCASPPDAAPLPFCGPVLDGGCGPGHAPAECFATAVCPTLMSAGCVACHLDPTQARAYALNWPRVPGARDLYASVMAYRRANDAGGFAPYFLTKGSFGQEPDGGATLGAVRWLECEAEGVCP